MSPQDRETARWKARIQNTDDTGVWVGGSEGEHCAVGGGKPKLCLPTRKAARDHRADLIAAGCTERLTVFRCSFAAHYHVGKPR